MAKDNVSSGNAAQVLAFGVLLCTWGILGFHFASQKTPALAESQNTFVSDVETQTVSLNQAASPTRLSANTIRLQSLATARKTKSETPNDPPQNDSDENPHASREIDEAQKSTGQQELEETHETAGENDTEGSTEVAAKNETEVEDADDKKLEEVSAEAQKQLDETTGAKATDETTQDNSLVPENEASKVGGDQADNHDQLHRFTVRYDGPKTESMNIRVNGNLQQLSDGREINLSNRDSNTLKLQFVSNDASSSPEMNLSAGRYSVRKLNGNWVLVRLTDDSAKRSAAQ